MPASVEAANMQYLGAILEWSGEARGSVWQGVVTALTFAIKGGVRKNAERFDPREIVGTLNFGPDDKKPRTYWVFGADADHLAYVGHHTQVKLCVHTRRPALSPCASNDANIDTWCARLGGVHRAGCTPHVHALCTHVRVRKCLMPWTGHAIRVPCSLLVH